MRGGESIQGDYAVQGHARGIGQDVRSKGRERCRVMALDTHSVAAFGGSRLGFSDRLNTSVLTRAAW